jgi:hypothetical protein
MRLSGGGTKRLRMAVAWCAALAVCCGCGSKRDVVAESCTADEDCADGWTCADGVCRRADADVDADDGVDLTDDPADVPADLPPDTADEVEGCEDGREPCGGVCCADDEACAAGVCGIDTGCTDDDGCGNDSYCVSGVCIPYGTGPRGEVNEECERSISVEPFNPVLQCSYSDPPEDDPAPGHVQVMSTPMVADLDMDFSPAILRPSIIFSTFAGSNYQADGVLRIIDGETCELQQVLAAAEDRTVGAAPVAVGDIAGDSRPEIVAPASGGGLVAFHYTAGAYTRLWRSAWCDGSGGRTDDGYGATRWAGAAIHDLDDDGTPEIVFGGVVYDADGCIVTDSLGYPGYSVGVVPVIADVDLDGAPELVFGDGIYAFESGDWVAEEWFTDPGEGAGQVAVADFGDFPVEGFDGLDLPEVAVVSSGWVRVQSIDGTVVFGPYQQPGAGNGGPPTASDFDGDGRVEFAAAGLGSYTVFDLDCVEGGDGAGCGTGGTEGILWSQDSQDNSSSVTGSSIFDFEGDGPAEAIYADECYLRVYRGSTGEVIFSQARSSGTTYENPVVADVDGDYNSELVTSVNDYHSIGCVSPDPLFPAATHTRGHGIRVFQDASDLWVGSRPVWNQHPYAVTHVEDGAGIPATSDVEPNWTVDGLNNFRQQVQGELEALDAPDLTAGAGGYGTGCDEDDPVIDLTTMVCNRGTAPIAAGMTVEFWADGEPGADGTLVCTAATATPLDPGECEAVPCEWDPAPADGLHPVHVVVDPENTELECFDENNWTTFEARCESLG